MNALFLKDLALKTHRGIRGRVEAGKLGGGNAYGYRVVKQLDVRGEPIRGEREISGLMFCGCCDQPYVRRGQDRYCCTSHLMGTGRTKSRTITRDKLEARVVNGLKNRLMAPDKAAEAMRAFAEETNRLNRERRTSRESDQHELPQIKGAIGEIVARRFMPSANSSPVSCSHRVPSVGKCTPCRMVTSSLLLTGVSQETDRPCKADHLTHRARTLARVSEPMQPRA
ncbi:zinc ribbon domain-containing protein [Ancylobacter radicis]|uniref:zinc ribbon domain-containing protein n=1 Tax=Ancylobacter radicis TaxID=2836179 RepID=UPI002022D167|nr:zinc ribbon domain-containing protein [Ancylobacter radicis]